MCLAVNFAMLLVNSKHDISHLLCACLTCKHELKVSRCMFFPTEIRGTQIVISSMERCYRYFLIKTRVLFCLFQYILKQVMFWKVSSHSSFLKCNFFIEVEFNSNYMDLNSYSRSTGRLDLVFSLLKRQIMVMNIIVIRTHSNSSI